MTPRERSRMVADALIGVLLECGFWPLDPVLRRIMGDRMMSLLMCSFNAMDEEMRTKALEDAKNLIALERYSSACKMRRMTCPSEN